MILLPNGAVVSAALRFYTAQTIITVTTPDGQTQQKMTLPLHSVTNPEEKRKIIGDTFMKVCVGVGGE